MSDQKEIVAPRAAVGSVSKSRKTSMERRSFLVGLLSAGLGFAAANRRFFYSYHPVSFSKRAV